MQTSCFQSLCLILTNGSIIAGSSTLNKRYLTSSGLSLRLLISSTLINLERKTIIFQINLLILFKKLMIIDIILDMTYTLFLLFDDNHYTGICHFL